MADQLLQKPVQSATAIGGNFSIDDAIIAALPSGTKILSADSFGSSAWSVTARIVTETSNGSAGGYFMKCTTGDSGRAQLEGEFHAMTELYKTVPALIPKPHAWGKVTTQSPPTYFFLCDFVNISDRLPDPARVGARLAELHQKSISPTGKFGFHVPTYDGKLPQIVDWDESWPRFFSKLILGIFKLDVEVNGIWKELEDVLNVIVNQVIPRLLGALESDGRTVKPCLIHGDLWEGNIGTDIETGNIFIFDSCAYYAHNEMEIGMWRVEHHRMKAKAYKREYLRKVDISEPVEEFDDRNRLYSTKTKLMYSAHVPGTSVRNQAYEDFCYLVEKYAKKTPSGAGDSFALEGPQSVQVRGAQGDSRDVKSTEFQEISTQIDKIDLQGSSDQISNSRS